ncbi:MAG: hypothetical protein IKZ58_06495 [Selenomonadaceae bacterium]|nr:hypothetical protein [Selenomonadaceae bacterium]
MLEEKIMSEEIMNEEELNEVAGGTWNQVADDAENIRYLERRYHVDLLPPGSASADDINYAMNTIGELISRYYCCDFHIGCDLKLDGEKNHYYLNHNKMGHNQIWGAIYDRLNIEVRPNI